MPSTEHAHSVKLPGIYCATALRIPCSVMSLLSELHAQPRVALLCASREGARKKEEHSGTGTVKAEDEDLGEDGDEDILGAPTRLPPLASLVPRLWPLMAHLSTAVRLSTVLTLVRHGSASRCRCEALNVEGVCRGSRKT